MDKKQESSTEITFKLFKEGLQISEIAHKRNFTVSTIETHLTGLIQEKKIKVEELLDKDRIDLIKVEAKNHNTSKGIKEKLPEEVSYAEIKYVLASMGKIRPKKSAIEKAINTYIGNYCYRKCFNHDEILTDCLDKFEKLKKGVGNTNITVKELKLMIDNDSIKICKLPFDKREKIISWGYFNYLKHQNRDMWDE